MKDTRYFVEHIGPATHHGCFQSFISTIRQSTCQLCQNAHNRVILLSRNIDLSELTI